MKVKLSKNKWKEIGVKTGWIKEAVISDDGIADGGIPYTDEEMDLIERQDRMDDYRRFTDSLDKGNPSKISTTVNLITSTEGLIAKTDFDREKLMEFFGDFIFNRYPESVMELYKKLYDNDCDLLVDGKSVAEYIGGFKK